MRRYILGFLGALGVMALGSGTGFGDVGPVTTPESIDIARVVSGLTMLGIGDRCEIVVAEERDVVEATAAEVLQRFLARASLAVTIVTESNATGQPRIYLGRERNLKTIRDLGDAGRINIRSVSEADDGFHLKQIDRDVVVAGANPRGVLYGALAFEDFVNEALQPPLDIRRIPRIASRFESIPTFLMSDHPASFREAYDKTAAYFARLGVNGCIDGGGGSWELSRFVASDVFPFQKAPDPELQRRISSISSQCKAYGIDYYIMLWEPAVARVGAEVEKYPKDALGKVKRPWGGDANGMDTTLCVSSPIVQDHYRSMITKFVQQYPDVKGFLFYNLDGDTWLCTPDLCPRCKAVCTNSPGDTPHPWETQAQFTDFLARTAREARGDFRFIHWISHFRGDAMEKLVRTSKEYSALAYGVQNGDHDIMIADALTQGGPEFLMLQRVCEERLVPFYVTYSSNCHEVIPNGFQLPFQISRSLRKLDSWGVRGISGCGPIPYFNQINALTEKEFQWNPEHNPEAFLQTLARRQFGQEAGELMYRAWKEVADGMDVWNDMPLNPFCGSQTHVGIGFSYFPNARAIVPDIAYYFENSLRILTNVEPLRAPEYQKYRERDFLVKFETMRTHFANAAAFAEQAVERADPDRPIGIHYYESDSLPTMRDYAELNYGSLAIADTYCRLRCNMLQACQLLRGIQTDSATGNNAGAQEKKALYNKLILDDIAVRKAFIELLTKFSTMRPCLTRTSLSEEGIALQIAYMNGEIEKMEAFLKQD